MGTTTSTLDEMEKRSSAFAFVPEPPRGSPDHVLQQLAKAAATCRACPLFVRGTQTVFGEGPANAPLMLVGEQPGDKEDLAGRPFVGPAGAVLEKALAQAGLDRRDVYMTNAVKHFNYVASAEGGKARIHKKPRAAHIKACQAWVIEELKVVKPKLVLCLGATAAQSFMGPAFKLMSQRGHVIDSTTWGVPLMATYHPSALLRTPSAERRAIMLAELVRDLLAAAAFIRGEHPAPVRRKSLPVLF